METKSEQFRDALDDAREIVDRAKVQDRDLTAGEKSKVDRLIAKAERLKGDLKDEALVGRIDELLGGGGGGSGDGWVDGRSRKTLWECLQAVGGAKTLATTPSVAVPTDFLYPPGPNEGPGGSPIFDSFPQKRGIRGERVLPDAIGRRSRRGRRARDRQAGRSVGPREADGGLRHGGNALAARVDEPVQGRPDRRRMDANAACDLIRGVLALARQDDPCPSCSSLLGRCGAHPALELGTYAIGDRDGNRRSPSTSHAATRSPR